jgi:hypothetical protein
MRRRTTPGPSLGLLAGTVGGAAGLLAMRLYWEGITRFQSEGDEGRPPSRRTPEHSGGGSALDDVSLVGRHHRRGETSTAATGRIAFRAVTGHDPGHQTRKRLDYGVHWAFGLSMGGLYGLLRRKAGFPDARGGMAFSTGVWLIGDELMVPLLGLQGGPTAASPAQHLNRLCAHLAYGAGLAVATQGLLRVMGGARSPRPGRPRPRHQARFGARPTV